VVNKKFFSKLKKELEDKDKLREKNIILSRQLTKKSKQAIYLIHRGEGSKAEKLLREVKKSFPKNNENMSSSLEEYAEAMLFLHFAKTKKILPYEKLKVGAENYLGGMADFTGELGRLAVLLGSKKQTKDVELIRDLVDEIFGEFMKIDFRNGELRRKYDAIKWNLSKIEQILYDLKIHA